MRLHLILLILFISSFANAQRNPYTWRAKQVKQIVELGAPSHFNRYKGEVLHAENVDTLYASTLEIMYTTSNQIACANGNCLYSITVGKENSRKKAEKLLNQWKLEIQKVYRDSLEVKDFIVKNRTTISRGIKIKPAPYPIYMYLIKERKREYQVYLYLNDSSL